MFQRREAWAGGRRMGPVRRVRRGVTGDGPARVAGPSRCRSVAVGGPARASGALGPFAGDLVAVPVVPLVAAPPAVAAPPTVPGPLEAAGPGPLEAADHGPVAEATGCSRGLRRGGRE